MYTLWIKQCQIMLLIIFLVLAGCDDHSAKSIKKINHKTWQLPIAKVVVQDLPINYNSTGSVVSDQRIEVTSRMTGIFVKLLCVKASW